MDQSREILCFRDNPQDRERRKMLKPCKTAARTYSGHDSGGACGVELSVMVGTAMIWFPFPASSRRRFKFASATTAQLFGECSCAPAMIAIAEASSPVEFPALHLSR